ncbi:hypothetical protein [uncultured Gammaproteobacteria bacterium]|nr:hypothetical protein [uncultured Gammaproteobacteria bacterium]CAC9519495.1 hypothetical protein [uncultured Gammaproteobacteria bacterium]
MPVGFHLMGETVFLVEIIMPVEVCVFLWFLFLVFPKSKNRTTQPKKYQSKS